MKTIKELQYVPLKLTSTDMYFSRIKELPQKKLDMDVYLPSIGINLQRYLVWTLQQKQELIMSVFYDRYIPPVRVMSLIEGNGINVDDTLQVIDGKQRLTAFLEFLDNKFPVEIEGSEYLLSELPKDYQFTFNNYVVKCQMAYEQFDREITDQDKIDWFEIINFSGTPQDKAHMVKLKTNVPPIR